ncbi:hypothetical protein KAK07_11815 [Ideonella sp. 4Y16]|uniref:radical SAM protein n=1 Tax=Ideonella alba TaxID=2824118 RepID=UPI001B369463|nr:radical SAM protein [Ideonella alba]MBQ0944021.1 hypothetical protein [Ideonella alba]
MQLTSAQRLKFQLFEHGLSITRDALQALKQAAAGQALSSDDFASTSGIILRLEDNVWVNAPVSIFNPNFVVNSPYLLEHGNDGFVVRGNGLESRAKYWPQPKFHSQVGADGLPLTNYVVTHGDRARLSPIHGCGMVCKFCDVPYGVRYGKKPIPAMVDAVGRAIADPLQPARHLLISGGTPRSADIGWLKEVYRAILTSFPSIDIDIMMVPVDDLLNVEELGLMGVHQLSINLELFSDYAARRFMPQKFRQGRNHYLNFIENSATALGAGRVRSMLMVGLEPPEETLHGVQAIVERGGVPVLSPFRPDPTTPLKAMPPPSADLMQSVFLSAMEIVDKGSAHLGPSCVPCTHNTLTLASTSQGSGHHSHGQPFLV